jgi:hypothetical protein
VLDNVARHDSREPPVEERQVLRTAADQPDVGKTFLVEPLPRDQEPAERNVDTPHGPSFFAHRREERTGTAAKIEERPGRNRPERVAPPLRSLRGGQDMGDLAPSKVRWDLRRKVEVALQQTPEVEPVEVFLEASGEGPVVAIGEENVVLGSQVEDPAQAGV